MGCGLSDAEDEMLQNVMEQSLREGAVGCVGGLGEAGRG